MGPAFQCFGVDKEPFFGTLTEMETTFIYALCEPTSRTVRYIGKTSTTPQNRLKRHLKESVRLDTHLGRWLRKIASCGAVPSLVVLREVLGDGSEAEKRYIRLARGCHMNLVNGTDGGDGGVPTLETRAKQSAANAGENHPMFGRSPSKETRVKQSVANTGRTQSKETRMLISAAKAGENNPMFGRSPSEETRVKLSAANSGENNPMFGRKHTDEEKAKMREAHARRKAAKV